MKTAAARRGRDPVITGPYVHAPENIAFISFETEGETPRSFSILIAESMIVEGRTYPANGIAILDNDNVSIVFDRAYEQDVTGKGPSRDQRTAFNFIQALGWREFSYFCRTRDGYRGAIADIDSRQPVPDPGHRDNQLRIGALDPAFVDNRNALIRSLHAQPELPYSFPRASRDSMVNEIMAHLVHYGREGTSHLAWDIRMNFPWNKTGKIITNGENDGEEVDPAFDAKWLATLRHDTEIFEKACDNCIRPFVDSGFSPFEIEEVRADLRVAGANGGFIALRSFNDTDMGFTTQEELHGKLTAMDDATVMNLWMTVRTLDIDLSREVRGNDMALQLNSIRAERELTWREEVEEELSF